ncbi:MAG: carboxypeptidase regulatory-like domain-containing protein [bacterium]
MKLTTCLLVGVWMSWAFTGPTRATEPTDAGSISGTVTFQGKVPEPQKLKVDKDLEICGQHEKYSEELLVSETGGLENVVIQLVGAKGVVTIPKGKDRPSITQKECQFSPHVQVVPAGTRMSIFNEDGIAHNIHTLGVENPSFNQQQPGIKKRMVTKKNDFAVPEMIPIKCDIHQWMKAWIVVADHPFHAVSDDGGAFKISGVPAGTYTVEFWHETLGKQTQEVTVKPGADVEVQAVFKAKKS